MVCPEKPPDLPEASAFHCTGLVCVDFSDIYFEYDIACYGAQMLGKISGGIKRILPKF